MVCMALLNPLNFVGLLLTGPTFSVDPTAENFLMIFGGVICTHDSVVSWFDILDI